MKVLSCGAGMQSMALALMSCENKLNGAKYEFVPIYDAVVFVNLGSEPKWVREQVKFIQKACKNADIPFYELEKNLYKDYMERFGKAHVSAFPFWSIGEDGKKAKMWRHCTICLYQKYILSLYRLKTLYQIRNISVICVFRI